MTRSSGSHQMIEPINQHSFGFSRVSLWFSFFVGLLLSPTQSAAFYQLPIVHQRPFLNRDTTSKDPYTKAQIESLPTLSIHHLTNRQQITNKMRAKIDKSTTMMTRKHRVFKKSNVASSLLKKRFRLTVLRMLSSLFSLMTAFAVLNPKTAFAATIQDAASVVAPSVAAPIIMCPVSAATELKLMIRLVFAAIIGAALGRERSLSKHSAGVRTMSLVAMGAAVFTVCNYGFSNFAKVDASRMAANVASGVGFVGAGVITTSMRNQNKGTSANSQNNVVHGLTTAATIWLSAAVGVACGVGLLRVATTAAFTTIFILRMGRKKGKNPSKELFTVPKQHHRSMLFRDAGGNSEIVNSNNDIDGKLESHNTSHRNDYDPKPILPSENSEAASPFVSRPLQDRLGQEAGGKVEVEDESSIVEIYDGEDINDVDTLESDMEKLVFSAWNVDTKSINALVEILVDRVKQRESIPKSNLKAREDDSSSTNSESLP